MQNLFFYNTYNMKNPVSPYLSLLPFKDSDSKDNSTSVLKFDSSIPNVSELKSAIRHILMVLKEFSFFQFRKVANDDCMYSQLDLWYKTATMTGSQTARYQKYLYDKLIDELYQIFESDEYKEELIDIIILYHSYKFSRLPHNRRIKNSSRIITTYLGSEGKYSQRFFTDKLTAIRKKANQTLGHMILPAFINGEDSEGQKKAPTLKIYSPLDIEFIYNIIRSAAPAWNPFLGPDHFEMFHFEQFLKTFSRMTLSKDKMYLSQDELKEISSNIDSLTLAVHNQYALERITSFNFILALYSIHRRCPQLSNNLFYSLQCFIDFPLPATRLRILKYISDNLDSITKFDSSLHQTDLALKLSAIRRYHFYLLLPALKNISDVHFQKLSFAHIHQYITDTKMLERFHYFEYHPTDTELSLFPVGCKEILADDIQKIHNLPKDAEKEMNKFSYSLYKLFDVLSQTHAGILLNDLSNNIKSADYLSWLMQEISSQVDVFDPPSIIMP